MKIVFRVLYAFYAVNIILNLYMMNQSVDPQIVSKHWRIISILLLITCITDLTMIAAKKIRKKKSENRERN